MLIEGIEIGSIREKPEKYEPLQTPFGRWFREWRERRREVVVEKFLNDILRQYNITDLIKQEDDEHLENALSTMSLDQLRMLQSFSHTYLMEDITGSIGVSIRRTAQREQFIDALATNGSPYRLETSKNENIWQLMFTPRDTHPESPQIHEYPMFLECIDLLRFIAQKKEQAGLPRITYCVVEPILAKELLAIGFCTADVQENKQGKAVMVYDEIGVHRGLASENKHSSEDIYNVLLFIETKKLFDLKTVALIENWRDKLYRQISGQAVVTSAGRDRIEKDIRVKAIRDFLRVQEAMDKSKSESKEP